MKVPIHKVGRQIQVKVNACTNAASYTAGIEIYGVNVWAMPLREARGTSAVQFQ